MTPEEIDALVAQHASGSQMWWVDLRKIAAAIEAATIERCAVEAWNVGIDEQRLRSSQDPRITGSIIANRLRALSKKEES